MALQPLVEIRALATRHLEALGRRSSALTVCGRASVANIASMAPMTLIAIDDDTTTVCALERGATISGLASRRTHGHAGARRGGKHRGGGVHRVRRVEDRFRQRGQRHRQRRQRDHDDVTPIYNDSSPPSDTGTGPDTSGDNCCPANAQYIYITGEGAQLWSFWPPTFTFKLVGTLTCTTFPTHMTVDRTGTAWVVGGGNVYKTSTLNATCSTLGTWSPQIRLRRLRALVRRPHLRGYQPLHAPGRATASSRGSTS